MVASVSEQRRLESHGLDEAQFRRHCEALSSPSGVVLITGAVGTGKDDDGLCNVTVVGRKIESVCGDIGRPDRVRSARSGSITDRSERWA